MNIKSALMYIHTLEWEWFACQSLWEGHCLKDSHKRDWSLSDILMIEKKDSERRGYFQFPEQGRFVYLPELDGTLN